MYHLIIIGKVSHIISAQFNTVLSSFFYCCHLFHLYILSGDNLLRQFLICYPLLLLLCCFLELNNLLATFFSTNIITPALGEPGSEEHNLFLSTIKVQYYKCIPTKCFINNMLFIFELYQLLSLYQMSKIMLKNIFIGTSIDKEIARQIQKYLTFSLALILGSCPVHKLLY